MELAQVAEEEADPDIVAEIMKEEETEVEHNLDEALSANADDHDDDLEIVDEGEGDAFREKLESDYNKILEEAD